jgi:hypothetical protein
MAASVINTYTFWFDSKYRTRGTNHHPQFDIEHAPTLSNPNNYFECELISADLPFSFFALQDSYNSIKYSLVVPNHSINYTSTFEIPPGNYSILELLEKLSACLIIEMTNAGLSPSHQPAFNFTYDRSRGKVTLGFATLRNDDFTLTLRWTETDLIAPYFGFEYSANTVLSYLAHGTITSTNYISPDTVNVNPISVLHLRSDKLSQSINQQEMLVEPYCTVSNVIARVPVNVAYNTWFFYQSQGFKVQLRNNTIETIDLYWTCLSYDDVIFEGVNWRAQIQIREMEYRWVTDLMKEQRAAEMASKQTYMELMNEKRKLVDATEEKVSKIRKRLPQLPMDGLNITL